MYKFLYWDYEIVIQIMSEWQIEPVMNGEIDVYWDVCIELWAMNCVVTIVGSFKGDEFLCDEYCDEIHCEDPTSLITSATR